MDPNGSSKPTSSFFRMPRSYSSIAAPTVAPNEIGIEAVLVAEEVGVGEGLEIETPLAAPSAHAASYSRPPDAPWYCGLSLMLKWPGSIREMRPQAMVQPKHAPLVTRFALPSVGRFWCMASPEIADGPFELHVAMITRRQRAQFVDDVHQHLGAVGGQSLAGHAICRQRVLPGLGRREKRVRVRKLERVRAGAAHGHRLEVLGSHHRANARPPGRPVQVVDDRGVEHAVVAGAADGRDADLRILVGLLDVLLGRPDRLAPQVSRRPPVPRGRP